MSEVGPYLLSLVPKLLSAVTPALVLLIYVFRHPEKVEQWLALFYRLLDSLSRYTGILRGHFAKGRIASEIQAIVNTPTRELSKESPQAVTHLLKVEWVTEEKIDAYLRKGEVVVRLSRHENQDKNIVNATLLYLSRALLPQARNLVDVLLMKGTEYTVAKRMFALARGTGALDCFFREVLAPALEQSPALRQDVNVLADLDDSGFFTRVYLNELHQLGSMVPPPMPSDRIRQETREFVDFLHTIATKERDSDVPLKYHGARIKAAIVLVARPGVVEYSGIGVYERRIDLLIRDRFNIIYIAGRGNWNIDSVRRILDKVKSEGKLTTEQVWTFTTAGRRGESTQNILALCNSNVEYENRQQATIEPVLQVLSRWIPQIAEGKWQIVHTVRWPRRISTISLKGAGPSDAAAIRHWGRQSAEVLDKVRGELGGESIFLVSWSADTREFVVSALGLWPESVSGVEINQENLRARVFVRSEEALKFATGATGMKLKVASQLTGYDIQVVIRKSRDDMPAEAHPIWDGLHESVPELQQGSVSVEAIAREPGYGSKVVLKSGSSEMRSPSEVCRGKGYTRLESVKRRVPGERLLLHDWSDDQKTLIIGALYPLRSREVLHISIDQDSRTADVLVTTVAALRRAAGEGWSNVRLAQAVTGFTIRLVSREASGEHPKDRDESNKLVFGVLRQHIPEIQSGEVEVVNYELDPGVVAKIRVRYRDNKRQGQWLIALCTGPNNERLLAISKALGGAFVTFAEMSDDPGENILRALFPLMRGEVKSIELRNEQRQARVVVASEDSLAKAMGPHLTNLVLAERLTGWAIQLESAEYSNPRLH